MNVAGVNTSRASSGGAEVVLCAAQLRSPDVSVAVKRNAEFMRLRKMNENASKTDQEILEMIL